MLVPDYTEMKVDGKADKDSLVITVSAPLRPAEIVDGGLRVYVPHPKTRDDKKP